MDTKDKLIEKLKEIADIQDKMLDILLRGWNNEDNNVPYPADLEQKADDLKAEIASLDKQIAEGKGIPVGAEEILENHLHYTQRNDEGFYFIDYNNGTFERIIKAMEEYAQIKVKEAMQSNNLKNE